MTLSILVVMSWLYLAWLTTWALVLVIELVRQPEEMPWSVKGIAGLSVFGILVADVLTWLTWAGMIR